jgi:carboxyl-terminal processing protease
VLLAVGVFGAGLGVGVGLDRTGAIGGPAAEVPSADAAEFGLIREAWDLLHERYVDAADLDSTALAYGAIEGLTDAIGDTGHTSFLTPEELQQAHDSLSGSYVGIGVALDIRDGQPIVSSVFRGSPAAEAGIKVGDIVLAVDGTSVTGDDLDRIGDLVRGEVGTDVRITLSRPSEGGAAEPIDLRIVRGEIDVPVVSWAQIPGTAFVMLRLEQFGTGSADQLEAALIEIQSSEASGIVLDLRGNGGGYVNESVAVASDFLASGVVHLSRDASGEFTPTNVQPDGVATEIPLVVLVDGGTASSAEILAGALQDNDRAEVIGRKTYGTGTVLSEVSLSDGSALRIGVIEWLTPDGREIWHAGIAPDHSVTLPTDVTPLAPEDLESMGTGGLASSGDVQLLAAIEELRAEVALAG